jgi:hypothetical protein
MIKSILFNLRMLYCHPRENGDPDLSNTCFVNHRQLINDFTVTSWIPACAGMTKKSLCFFQGEAEGAADIFLRLDPNSPIHRLYDLSADIEPKAGAFYIQSGNVFYAEEFVE